MSEPATQVGHNKACIELEKIVKQQYLVHMSLQHRERRPTNG